MSEFSGPGAALQAHLELFEQLDRVKKSMAGAKAGRVAVGTLGPAYHQRVSLLSATPNIAVIARGKDGEWADDPVGSPAGVDGLSMAEHRSDNAAVLRGDAALLQRAIGMVNTEHTMLDAAETHYVSASVVHAVTAAAKKMAPEPLYETDLPAMSGLIVMEHPLIMDDLHPDTGKIVPGLSMPVRMIGWHRQPVHVYKDRSDPTSITQTDGIFYVMYADRDSYRAVYVPAIEKLLGRESQPTGIDASDLMRFWASDCSGWSFGASWHPTTDPDFSDAAALPSGELHQNTAFVRSWLLSYFRWTWQRILVKHAHHPTKPEVKRWKRAGLEDGHIKVLRLRRELELEKRRSETGEDYVADHQWVVRGHWRRVYYKSMGPARLPDGSFNAASHRLTWIEPYIAGNPYGPLVRGHNVTAAVR